jgi:hypothetical protein
MSHMVSSVVIVLCVFLVGSGLLIMYAPTAFKHRQRHLGAGRVGDVAWLLHPATELVGLAVLVAAVIVLVYLALN